MLTNQPIGHHNCSSSIRTNSDIQGSSDRVSDPEFLQSWRPSPLSISDSGPQDPDIRLETRDTRLSCPGIKVSRARRCGPTSSFYKLYNFADSLHQGARTSVHSGKLEVTRQALGIPDEAFKIKRTCGQCPPRFLQCSVASDGSNTDF